jgi:hypothetical protein
LNGIEYHKGGDDVIPYVSSVFQNGKRRIEIETEIEIKIIMENPEWPNKTMFDGK